MATYNGEKYIKEQLESILCQLGDNDEVIISDDKSTDNTKLIIESFNDRRVRFFNNTAKKGVIENFENALLKSTGDYIFLSDQDDVWNEGKVTKTLEALKTYDLVLSDAYIVDSNGRVLHDSFYKINGSKKGFLKNIIKNSYLGCAMAFNRKTLEACLPLPSNIPMHDWWIGLVAETHGRVVHLDEKFINHRRHSNNTSFTGEVSQYSFFKKIYFRLIITFKIIFGYYRARSFFIT